MSHKNFALAAIVLVLTGFSWKAEAGAPEIDIRGLSGAPEIDIRGLSGAPEIDIRGLSGAPEIDIRGLI
jgi:hypothetical protein